MLPNKVSWKRSHAPSNHEFPCACGTPGIESVAALPVGLFGSADSVSHFTHVENLALGKQGGGLYHPLHWRYWDYSWFDGGFYVPREGETYNFGSGGRRMK